MTLLRSRVRATLVVALSLALLGPTSPTGAAAPPPASPEPVRASLVNPVSAGFADTFADPSLLRGKDGWWYAYGTSDPLRAGEPSRQIPISRSRDLVHWSFVGEAFTAASRPSWATPEAGLWAPDIRYVDGSYRLYYVVTRTTATTETDDNAIGMATAPTPAGPWTDSGAPVVGPRRGAGASNDFLWTFDPSVVTDTDGSQHLFYGSYYGGVYVQPLDAAGRRPVGQPTMVAIDNKFEGAYVVRHGRYWYLFASTANCCAGPTTGYSVQVGRSTSLAGPYLDAEGVALTASRAGGTPVLTQNGNRWIGAGHNAVATDLAGQDWIVYHALDRAVPYLDGTDGIVRRPMLLDRLDWIDGWPITRAGRGPSSGSKPGPATSGRWVEDFSDGIPDRWRGSSAWSADRSSAESPYALSTKAGELLAGRSGQRVRVEADLRSSAAAFGLQAETVRGDRVEAVVDPQSRTLRLSQQRSGRVLSSRTAPLPGTLAAAAWHSVTLQVADGRATATLSHARLGDPLATVSLDLRGRARVQRAGALARGAGVAVDNLSVLPAVKPVSRRAAEPVPHRIDRAASDEFGGSAPAAGWTWVRRDTAATVGNGVLRWPTQAADLVGTGNDAGVLLRSPGAGSWTAETKVSIDLGTDTIRNFQQAGLVAYVNDDEFARLSHVAIWNTRQTEFGKEMPYAGRLSYGGTIVGPPAATTWLRLTHTLDPATGEHRVRGWSSRDGRRWVEGGVWTLPAGSDVKIGLVSHGGTGATAEFDYLRLFR